MANLFTAEQIAFLDKRYARIPHDHTWEQVKDTDGQTVADAFEAIDAAIEAIDAAIEDSARSSTEYRNALGDDEDEGEADVDLDGE